MPTEIRMPRLVDTMTQGSVVAWRVSEGEFVTAGQAIAEVEVDKTTVDLEAPGAGILTKITVPAGSEKVDVGVVLAILDQDAGPPPAVNYEHHRPAFRPSNGSQSSAAQQPDEFDAQFGQPSPESMPAPLQLEVDASPLARSTARQAGFDLSSLQGSGPAGRIMQADVLSALGLRRAPQQARPPQPSATPGARLAQTSLSYDEIPHSQVRQLIAQRLSASKRTVPHFYLEVSCRIDALLQWRSGLQATRPDGIKFSVNDFAVRAAALALTKVPDANSSWTDTGMRRYHRVDLAIAVATDAGLVAPIVRDADRKGLAELAAELRDLTQRARERRLRPDELDGGTFTISNLGMYGVESLYAIVNPPQAGILGLGTAEQRPVVVDGAIAIATTMTCTLSADHRVIDGATGSRFLTTFKSLIEQPGMLIGAAVADGH
jgi:pyruvate dehydrogenase E2 component (dihydrolipoamide acetyltransferase)